MVDAVRTYDTEKFMETALSVAGILLMLAFVVIAVGMLLQ